MNNGADPDPKAVIPDPKDVIPDPKDVIPDPKDVIPDPTLFQTLDPWSHIPCYYPD